MNETGLLKLAFCIEVMIVAKLGNQAISLRYPYCLIDNEYAVRLCIIDFSIKLIQAVSLLNTVDREVEITVFFDDLSFTVGIRNIHRTVFLEVIHTTNNTVCIFAYPQGGVLNHLAATCVEEVVIFSNLGKAASTNIIREIVRIVLSCYESIGNNVSIFIAPIRTAFEIRCVIKAIANITRAVFHYCTIGSAIDDTVFKLHGTIEPLTVFTVIGLTFVLNKAIAKLGSITGGFIEMPPSCGIVGVFNNRIIAVNDIARVVGIHDAIFKTDPFTSHNLAGPVVAGSLRRLNKSTEDQSAFSIKGVLLTIDRADVGVCCEGYGVEVVEAIHNCDPAGGEFTELRVVTLAVLC